MLAGAFFTYLVAWKTAQPASRRGLRAWPAGMLFAVVMGARLTIEAKADQIVSGVGINLAAAGSPATCSTRSSATSAQIVVPDHRQPARSRCCRPIPDFGPALFNNDWTLYLAFLLVPISLVLLYRTKWGLADPRGRRAARRRRHRRRQRAARALDSACSPPGALAGLGGANLAIVQVGIFHQEMTAGRGFLALVAVIFGRWRRLGVLGRLLLPWAAPMRCSCGWPTRTRCRTQVWGVVAGDRGRLAIYYLVPLGASAGRASVAIIAGGDGRAVGVVLVFAAPHIDLPDQLWRSLPFLLALVVLAGAVSRAHMPSKLTLPYTRGDD